jgi:hypothetical protein
MGVAVVRHQTRGRKYQQLSRRTFAVGQGWRGKVRHRELLSAMA